LCLVANDPADMLGVTIAHAVPVPDALIGLCKRCVLAIVKTAMATELISPQEVFGDAPAAATSLDNPGDAHPADNHPAGAGGAESPESETPGEHRPEPEMSPGGEKRARLEERDRE
jgi:hypothetical protein